MAKSTKKIKKELISDGVKRRVLQELGYFEKVKKLGWDSLNSKECGRVGGMISREKKKNKELASK